MEQMFTLATRGILDGEESSHKLPARWIKKIFNTVDNEGQRGFSPDFIRSLNNLEKKTLTCFGQIDAADLLERILEQALDGSVLVSHGDVAGRPRPSLQRRERGRDAGHLARRTRKRFHVMPDL